MASEKDKQAVRDIIRAIYTAGQISPVWNGEITDEVAEVVMKILQESQKCSRALAWIPRPPGGRATVTWLATNLARALYATQRDRVSLPCTRAAILKWRSALDMASTGLALTRKRVQA